MPPGPGMMHAFERLAIKHIIDELPAEQQPFAKSIAQLALDYADIKNQIIPLGATFIFLLGLGSALKHQFFYTAIIVLGGSLLIYLLRKYFMTKYKKIMIEKCNHDVTKLKIVEKLCHAF